MQAENNIEALQQYDISSYWNAATAIGFSTAMWRLPNKTDTYFLTSFTKQPTQLKIDLDELAQGFAFAPYDNPTGEKTSFLTADLLISCDSSTETKVLKSPNEFDLNWQKIQNNLNNRKSLPKNQVCSFVNGEVDDEKIRFIASVQLAIKAIKKGDLQKVVLSRKKTFNISEIDINTIFENLSKAYPTAFVSVVYLPHLNEIWLGASPEVLVIQDANRVFKTMALAGTQSVFGASAQIVRESDAAWRQKEIEEQALVSRYIINCFKKVRVREFEELGPRTVRAGNLLHLQTIFSVDTNAIDFPQLASVMLDLLHPTSAVCGMPKKAATDFIAKEENYDREFYSGFLGPINIKNETNLFVNLRTMKVKNSVATLFAGCGITADSDPEKEWLETEMKCKTIEDILIA